ncbi:MAG: GntR family transcriptional regulator [Burkholderiales bacterium]|nr:GntR family transcriptional regulator [Burkholderiales bacterium]
MQRDISVRRTPTSPRTATAAAPARAPLLREDLYERIRAEIITCALAPGAQVHEQELARRYRVSKSPIRDALLKLHAERLVEVVPRRGYRVRPISLADAAELYDMRLILERACVERVIANASNAEIASLERYRRVPARVRLPAWIDYNRRFHVAIASICGNQRLARATIEIIQVFDRLTYTGLAALGDARSLERFVAEHGVLIDAIKRRDRRKAVAAIRRHIEGSRRRMLAQFAHPAIVP